MATRSKTSAEKRRKEMARKDKQRTKLERRAQRKPGGEPGAGPPIEELEDFSYLDVMAPIVDDPEDNLAKVS